MTEERNWSTAKIGSLVKYRGPRKNVGIVIKIELNFVDIYWPGGQKSMIGYAGILLNRKTIRLRHWQCRDILFVLA